MRAASALSRGWPCGADKAYGERMDEPIAPVSPEQLPEEISTRFPLEGVLVAVEPEGGRSSRFPGLGVSLAQPEVSQGATCAVTGHEPGGSFIEPLALLREVAQRPQHPQRPQNPPEGSTP